MCTYPNTSTVCPGKCQKVFLIVTAMPRITLNVKVYLRNHDGSRCFLTSQSRHDYMKFLLLLVSGNSAYDTV